ncbi:MAG: hypothetical protein ACK5P6_04215 [Pseudobdellovibrionaceae bacterium]
MWSLNPAKPKGSSAFIRINSQCKSFSAMLAREITGAKKGNPFGKFWDGLVFTRILLTRFEELGLRGYFTGNHLQKEISYRQREEYLKKWNQFLYRLKQTRATPQSTPHLTSPLRNSPSIGP